MSYTYTERLIDILQKSPTPLSTRDLGVRLRFSQMRLPDYEVSSLLREMLREGQVEFLKGRWTAPLSIGSTRTSPQLFGVALPSLSEETFSLLSGSPLSGADTKPDIFITETQLKLEKPEVEAPSGRWGFFRKLIAYYRQCIRNEEGADASAFQNEIGKRFIYLRKSGVWYPRPGLSWRSTIPLSPYISPLINSLPSSAEDETLVIGYPVQAYYKEKEGEPDISIIRPVFYFTVEFDICSGGLVLICRDPRPEVNLGWLDYAFSRKSDRQRSFLSACGFINRWRPNDEAPGLERGELTPSLDNLVSALAAFMPERVRQPLMLNDISDHPIREPFETGIYNRAVFMLANRTKYTVTLLKELTAIEKTPDKVLDQTALRHIFAKTEDPPQPEANGFFHEAVVADIDPLNAEQRYATASLLTKNVTVVTGPPGTGKSQVVSSTVTNARLRGQTVLFASRNHKAIDAVIGRLSDANGLSLMVRTNSKDDPNLNITFAHAIQDMLARQRDKTAADRLERAKGDLKLLLAERGRKSRYARQAAELGTTLGELEEQMSYFSRKLPAEIISVLEVEPERFPSEAVRRLVQYIHGLHFRSSDGSFFGRFLDLLRALSILRSHRIARRWLQRVPGAIKLPAFPSLNTLKELQSDLPPLEHAIQYARLRIESRPHEAKISELPALEDTTKAIVELSQRIKEIATRSLSLDLASRSGLPPGADREELDGLRAAMNAMRTGLDEGVIRTETLRVLKERIPYILQIFPCWAVTNLSVGSRIPFVPSIFDLAIVDEASQSDIPSAIPILYRARRAGVVGDPFQLTHVSKLSTARDTMLRRQVGIKRVEDVRFAYTENSLYKLFEGSRGVEPVFLSETYRSAANIASYSNQVFYGGRLRVATDHSSLTVPRGMSPGIHWTEVSGEVQSAGGSGCFCREEVDEVSGIVRTLLLENDFKGTLGVVTPFRHQANRIRDVLFESDNRFYEALVNAQAHVDTAHGFQGDERDVIFFSLCAGPGMPNGSRSFLRETGYLFNVAISRARAVVHMVGNRDWARRCGIRHIEQLASPTKRPFTQQHHGPWHPHESPWEQKLYNALLEAGIETRPQFPVSSRRLDLAIIRDEPPLKIDIEVDGDCHRNPDGTRKANDLWRDIQLEGLGWKVMRFWTYQLREDMQGCVGKILREWRKHGRNSK